MKIKPGDVVTVGENTVKACVVKVGKPFAEISWFDPVGYLHHARVLASKLVKAKK